MSTETKFIFGVGLITLLIIVAGVFFLGNEKPKGQSLGVDINILYSNAQHTIGDSNAPTKILEFADFQCPACGAAHPIVKKMLAENKGKVYFVYRHYPLPTHKNSRLAAQSTEAASNQGKFWEMHDKIFENQAEWSELNNAEEIFVKYAGDLGMDVQKFKDDLQKVKAPIDSDYALGNKVGVDSTPTFFINGQKYPGVISEVKFQEIINGTK